LFTPGRPLLPLRAQQYWHASSVMTGAREVTVLLHWDQPVAPLNSTEARVIGSETSSRTEAARCPRGYDIWIRRRPERQTSGRVGHGDFTHFDRVYGRAYCFDRLTAITCDGKDSDSSSIEPGVKALTRDSVHVICADIDASASSTLGIECAVQAIWDCELGLDLACAAYISL